MRLSSISSYLSQSEAALLAVLAEKVMQQAEQTIKTTQIGEDRRVNAFDAQECAYTLKCVAEQSILENDGELYGWLKRVRESVVVKEGWIDLDGIVEEQATSDELKEQA